MAPHVLAIDAEIAAVVSDLSTISTPLAYIVANCVLIFRERALVGAQLFTVRRKLVAAESCRRRVAICEVGPNGLVVGYRLAAVVPQLTRVRGYANSVVMDVTIIATRFAYIFANLSAVVPKVTMIAEGVALSAERGCGADGDRNDGGREGGETMNERHGVAPAE